MISNLERQCRYPVYWPGHDGEKDWLLLTYVCDFRYRDADGNEVIEDVKGKILNDFRLKAKAVRFSYGKVVHIVTRKRQGARYLWFFDKEAEAKKYDPL